MKDTLTQIPSFNAFEHKIQTCKSPKLFLVDIRNFKAINMRYGDEGGNFILREFAKTLQAFAQEFEMELYRIQDDTFALLIEAPFELAKMERIIFALMEALKRLSYVYETQTIDIETFIGISFDHFNALEKAQKALQVAKAEQQPFVTYSEFANMLMEENEEAIETMMKNAITQGQIVLHFQAVVDADDQVYYREGLLRLADQQSVQSPRLFLKIAKERQFYDLLFKEIVQKACQLAEQKHQRIALNLTHDDLLNADLFDYLKTHIDPQLIFLEIQCDAKAPCEEVIPMLRALKAQGITLILDNVKCAELIAQFQEGVIDVVKLHGDLIRNCAIDPSAELICKSIIALCQSHRIKTIAAQLNSKAAREVAENLGCDLFQGYIVEQPHGME
jgi:EAL domain-containing protein (putative c-di-GMP-specific phosphodiesterase class I)/GGDEF domain-containing protein